MSTATTTRVEAATAATLLPVERRMIAATMIDAINDMIADVSAHVTRPTVATTATALVMATTAHATATIIVRLCHRRRRNSNPSPIRAQSTRKMGSRHIIRGLNALKTQPTPQRHCRAAIIAATTATMRRLVLHRHHAPNRHHYGVMMSAITRCHRPITATRRDHQWIITPPGSNQ